MKHIEAVIKALCKRGFMLKLPKCKFCAEEISFLGHVVNAKGVRMQGRKTEAIEKMEALKTANEVKRFLGMVGFYRNYIPNLAARTVNLMREARGKGRLIWTEMLQREFVDVKQAMISDPVMSYPDFDKEFIVTTDASKVGMGATLLQMYKGGEQVVANTSRCVQPAEANYGITQLEAAAVRWAVKKWKDLYLGVGKFTIITDHKELTTVFGSKGGQTGNTTLD